MMLPCPLVEPDGAGEALPPADLNATTDGDGLAFNKAEDVTRRRRTHPRRSGCFMAPFAGVAGPVLALALAVLGGNRLPLANGYPVCENDPVDWVVGGEDCATYVAAAYCTLGGE